VKNCRLKKIQSNVINYNTIIFRAFNPSNSTLLLSYLKYFSVLFGIYIYLFDLYRYIYVLYIFRQNTTIAISLFILLSYKGLYLISFYSILEVILEKSYHGLIRENETLVEITPLIKVDEEKICNFHILKKPYHEIPFEVSFRFCILSK